jgi:hypothetical protein
VWYVFLITEHPEALTVSAIDGKKYMVKKYFKNSQRASDILAYLNYVNTIVIARMRMKYKNSKTIDAEFLAKNYNGGALSEHIPKTSKNTSYVINKGDVIKLCLRNKKTGEFHDLHTLVFVNLHELAHMLDKKWGHSDSFWYCFQAVLREAERLGVHNPINYSEKPQEYCGITITSNPYFRKIPYSI